MNDSAQAIKIINNSVQLIFTLSDIDRYNLQELVTLLMTLTSHFPQIL